MPAHGETKQNEQKTKMFGQAIIFRMHFQKNHSFLNIKQQEIFFNRIIKLKVNFLKIASRFSGEKFLHQLISVKIYSIFGNT